MHRVFKYFLLVVPAGLLLNLPASPQITVSPETEYSRIRTMAHDGNLVEAESAAIVLLDSFPDYGDTWILLARIYGWQQNYEPARAILDSLILKEPGNADAIEARIDLALWMGDNNLAIDLADRILAVDPTNNSILDKKLKAEKALEAADTIGAVISPVSDSLIRNQPGSIGARNLETTGKTDLRAGYYFDTFSEPYGRFWQIFQAGASHLLRFGRVIGGVNIGNLHTDTDPPVKATEVQFEAEAYPIISHYDYAWLAYAYSPGKYFPTHRISAEYWHTFKYGWVASAGMRYYYFDRNIFIGTLSVEKYYKSWWFSPRVYLYFKDSIGVTTSYYLTARKYFNDINWLQLTAGYGTAPDEPFDIATDLERQNAFSVRVAYHRSVIDNLFIRAGLGYSREEYAESMQRNRFEGSLNLIYVLNNKK